MNSQIVKKVVIAGGGTAGWVAAAALSQQLGPLLEIVLVESDAIGTVGVGEASIPPMKAFHRLAGIDEREFMRATSSTFKLGIRFENWGRLGESYIHSFGRVGKPTRMADFQHIWLSARSLGVVENLDEYCLELEAAKAEKFYTSDQASINYAYHLDATAYAAYLRGICEERGVKRIEGKISAVNQDSSNGHITSLMMDSGLQVGGDFFIDCTGFRGLLIEQTLKTGYEDWSHWLPTDSAIAVQTRSTKPPSPYTRSIARTAGWQWQIPLQHRVGNGLVYCREYMTDEEAKDQLLNNLDGEILTEPRLIRYTTGRRRKTWNKNCLALGLASGFLEPLESTSIYLIMIGITRFIRQFPFAGISDVVVDFYNKVAGAELERIRDFIVLHYKLTEREDTPFWLRCKNQEIPETLKERMNLFHEGAHIFPDEFDLFRLDSWLQVMMGQGMLPKQHQKVRGLISEEDLKKFLHPIREEIAKRVESLPLHADFVNRYCPADEKPK